MSRSLLHILDIAQFQRTADTTFNPDDNWFGPRERQEWPCLHPQQLAVYSAESWAILNDLLELLLKVLTSIRQLSSILQNKKKTLFLNTSSSSGMEHSRIPTDLSNWDARRLLLEAGCRLSEEEVSHWDARRLLLGAAWRDSFPPLFLSPPLASSKPFMIKLRPQTSTFHLDLAKSMFVFFKTLDKAWPRRLCYVNKEENFNLGSCGVHQIHNLSVIITSQSFDFGKTEDDNSGFLYI